MFKLAAALGLVAGMAASTPAPTEMRGEELMAALRRGGYTVILRHARTDYTFQEAIGTVPTERYEQRNLSDAGVKDARLMGVVFRKYGVSFAEIIASPMFRTKETAEYAAGKPAVTMALRVIPSTDEQAALVMAAPKPGTNRLLVTHHFVIEKHVPGIKPGEVEESEGVVVRPDGKGGIELVGRFKLADWAALAGDTGPAGTSGAAGATAAGGAVTHGGGGGNFVTSGYVSGAPLPDTPAGHMADAYIQAFSSGDTTRMRAFIETSLEANPARPTADRVKSYVDLFAQHGALTVTGVDKTNPEELLVYAHVKGGALRMGFKPSATQHMKLASVTFATMNGAKP